MRARPALAGHQQGRDPGVGRRDRTQPSRPPAGRVPAARALRVRLEAYLALDPATRFVIALALVAAISLLYLIQTSTVTQLNYEVQTAAVEHTKLVREQ